MTFNELLSQYTWNDIHRTLLHLYPDEAKSILGYMQAFSELREDTLPIGSDLTICIETVTEEEESYENVYALRADDSERYALDFIPWAEVLSMPIEEEAFERYTRIEIICHILWEITFDDYSSEAVVKKGNKLKESTKEILRELGE